MKVTTCESSIREKQLELDCIILDRRQETLEEGRLGWGDLEAILSHPK